eukprot:4290081-Pyramimonas_sp.AAC.1
MLDSTAKAKNRKSSGAISAVYGKSEAFGFGAGQVGCEEPGLDHDWRRGHLVVTFRATCPQHKSTRHTLGLPQE